jgi:hypothetical protein
MVKRLDPQRKEELIFDIRMGRLGTMELARKFNLSPGTITGYKQRLAKNDDKEAANPRLTPSGDIEIPPGLSPKEWLERVRDCPEAPWDARKAAGVSLYRNETSVKDDTWSPASDPEGWAHDLFLLVLGQSAEVSKAVLHKLQESLAPKSATPAQSMPPEPIQSEPR